ncbi:peptide/nickel transport system ATP-binding protein [Neorhizobium huautlense]|uniref:Peptide/nickel transport system ATP-binding protein n=1 Tax=Neorhizobium huautlense TaxID=67774 RepID=A0ABT9PLH5_9HYPH|nr:ABC transporter ATP-binding protein [Neorhizobium huautlense]MDP9835315.1 peptide/nickel transport system ATP-binding protein [Neorhizobium huautlense]
MTKPSFDPTSAPVLEVKDLVIGLTGDDKSSPVLNGISISIRAGETVCLVGESGSGKSVTSLAAMGLLPRQALEPRSGEILFEGEDLLKADAGRMRALRTKSMAMIFQEPMTALNPVLTVGQQICEVLQEHTKLAASDQKKTVLEMMREVHLPDVERIFGSYPHQLSGGQRQRIMIAMALILKPKLLIADEPTTALDVTTQKQILKLIDEMQEKQGTAVLFITHDMGVVAEIADTVYVMNRGNVVENGPIDAILTEPLRDYTRKLLSSVPSLVPRAPRPHGSSEVVLSITELEKVYGKKGWFGKFEAGTKAATDVSFTLKKGRTLGIVGESGSGKSTVARCVMRLIDPTSGSIRIGGQEIADFSRRAIQPHRQHIQMVFQDPYRSLNPRITVGDSIIEGPMNYGVPKAEAMKRARELLSIVGLPDDAIKRYPHQFSGGQRQRIAIARAVAMNPKVLVADEAVSALDVSVQAQVLDLLADMQEKFGIAILFITHDLRVAAQICDDVIVMQKGRVVEYATGHAVLTNPTHTYTRQLIDAAPGRHWDFANFRPLETNAA